MNTVSPVPAWQRAMFYTLGGVTGEIVFTGIKNYPSFQGHTQLWVFPLYWFGSIYAFEPIHDKIRSWPLLMRVAIYACMIFLIEYAAGWATHKLTGECPWKYTSGYAIHGYIHPLYFPLWGSLGLLAEKVHDHFLLMPKLQK